MKRQKNMTPQITVITYDSPSGDIYDLYLDGKWANTYNSLSELTRDIQALIGGYYDYT